MELVLTITRLWELDRMKREEAETLWTPVNPPSPVIRVSVHQVVTTGASKARRKEEESRRGAAAAGRGARPVQCCHLTF